jgi:hypothetical protein
MTESICPAQDVYVYECENIVSSGAQDAQDRVHCGAETHSAGRHRECLSTVITISCGETVAAFPVAKGGIPGFRWRFEFLKLIAFLEGQIQETRCRVSVAGDIGVIGMLREIWLMHELPGDYWVQDTPIGPITHFSDPVPASQLVLGMKAAGKLCEI